MEAAGSCPCGDDCLPNMMNKLCVLVALALPAVAAGQTAANREEEATGRLDNLLVRPVGRWSWLAGRLGVEAGILVALGIVAGAATWIGAASQHGITWHYSRPPIVSIEYEMDLRGCRREVVVGQD